jgi:hypothetical protein
MPHTARNLDIASASLSDYRSNPKELDSLDLFFNPLFALLILFRECEIFDLGTAITIGGRSSSKDAKPGMERYHGADAAVAESAKRGRAAEDRKIDGSDSWGRKGRVTLDELAMRDRAVMLVASFVGWWIYYLTNEGCVRRYASLDG